MKILEKKKKKHVLDFQGILDFFSSYYEGLIE